MKKAKEAVSLMLAIMLALGIIGVGFEAATLTTEDLMIADFTLAETFSNVQNSARLSKNSNVKLSGKTTEKYILNSGGTGVSYSLPEGKRNFSGYDVINIWAYNDGYNGTLKDSTKSFTVVLRSDSSTAWTNNLAYKQIYFDWTGWKKISIPLSSLSVNGSVNWGNITDIQFRPGPLNATEVTDYWDDVYFDRIYLSASNPGYLLLEPEKCETYKILGANTSVFTKDSTLPYYNDFSVNWGYTQGQQVVLYDNASNLIDASNYTHLNFAMYSDKVTTEDTSKKTTARFYFHSTDGGWYQYAFDINWSGWKYFSVPLSDISIGGSSTTVAFADCDTVKGFRILCTADTLSPKLNFSRIVLTNHQAATLNADVFDIENNAENIQTPTNKAVLSYSNVLAEYVPKESVTVKVNGETITNYTVGTRANTVEIFLGDMKQASTYTVSVNGVSDIYGQKNNQTKTLTFKTIEKELELDENISFSAEEGGAAAESLSGLESLYANVKLKNNANRGRTVNVMVALYDSEHKLEKVVMQEKAAASGCVTEIGDVGFEISPTQGGYAKAFVWTKEAVPVGSIGTIPYEAE